MGHPDGGSNHRKESDASSPPPSSQPPSARPGSLTSRPPPTEAIDEDWGDESEASTESATASGAPTATSAAPEPGATLDQQGSPAPPSRRGKGAKRSPKRSKRGSGQKQRSGAEGQQTSKGAAKATAKANAAEAKPAKPSKVDALPPSGNTPAAATSSSCEDASLDSPPPPKPSKPGLAGSAPSESQAGAGTSRATPVPLSAPVSVPSPVVSSRPPALLTSSPPPPPEEVDAGWGDEPDVAESSPPAPPPQGGKPVAAEPSAPAAIEAEPTLPSRDAARLKTDDAKEPRKSAAVRQSRPPAREAGGEAAATQATKEPSKPAAARESKPPGPQDDSAAQARARKQPRRASVPSPVSSSPASRSSGSLSPSLVKSIGPPSPSVPASTPAHGVVQRAESSSANDTEGAAPDPGAVEPARHDARLAEARDDSTVEESAELADEGTAGASAPEITVERGSAADRRALGIVEPTDPVSAFPRVSRKKLALGAVVAILVVGLLVIWASSSKTEAPKPAPKPQPVQTSVSLRSRAPNEPAKPEAAKPAKEPEPPSAPTEQPDPAAAPAGSAQPAAAPSAPSDPANAGADEAAASGVTKVKVVADPRTAIIFRGSQRLGEGEVTVEVPKGQKVGLVFLHRGYNYRRVRIDGSKPEVTVRLLKIPDGDPETTN